MKLDAIVNACGPVLLRDLTGLPDAEIARVCRMRGWRPGRGMPNANILVAAAQIGARFDHVPAPEICLSALMAKLKWREQLQRGAWIISVNRPQGHVFGLYGGELRGSVRAEHVLSPVVGLWRQGR